MRIFAVSDLHTDFKENRLLLEQLSREEYTRDVLLVAGDIADRLEVIGETLALLRSRFARVFYTPGNHELWTRNDEGDSVEKYFRVIELCGRLGVTTSPEKEQGVWIVPLLSWYETTSGADGDAEELEGWADYYFCKWPERIGSPSAYFLKMNEPRIRSYDAPVVSLSHFLPRRDLLPPVESLRFKGLPEVSICEPLEDQIRRLDSIVHVFGHSHINCDLRLDGIRYVQHALRYPRERNGQTELVKLVWGEVASPGARD
ncbi:MAG TPA: metallophosphoesterase [Pyrinomonadaceae bacterium]|nr:metallophosphoesterase [Pyrinomonadaceae bacterium]